MEEWSWDPAEATSPLSLHFTQVTPGPVFEEDDQLLAVLEVGAILLGVAIPYLLAP